MKNHEFSKFFFRFGISSRFWIRICVKKPKKNLTLLVDLRLIALAVSQIMNPIKNNQVEFIHAYYHTCIPIALTAMIYDSNPDPNTKPRKTVYTDIKAKREAEVIYDEAAENGLVAAKMTEMVEGLGRDLLKISVSNTNES